MFEDVGRFVLFSISVVAIYVVMRVAMAFFGYPDIDTASYIFGGAFGGVAWVLAGAFQR